MSIPGFDAAQARYDSMLPEDPPIFRCVISREMNEDCPANNACDSFRKSFNEDNENCGDCDESYEAHHTCEPEDQDWDDEEPADFDDRRHGIMDSFDDSWADY